MSFPRYPKYKESGVEWLGQVPEHWEVKRVKHLTSRISSGKTPSGGSEFYVDEGIVFLRSQNVHDDGLRLEDVVFITEAVDQAMSVSRVREHDILLNITGASIGRSCVVPASFRPANVNQHVCVIRLKDRSQVQFIGWVFRAATIKNQIDHAQNGAAREGLNFEQIGAMTLALPPIGEQTAIAGFLDRETAKIDGLIAEQERLIELLKEKRQAVISHAVTRGLNPDAPMKDSGIKWIGQVPEHWEIKRLKHVSPSITVGIVVNPSSFLADKGLPFIYGGDIREGAIDWENSRRIDEKSCESNSKTKLSAGDLLTVRVGAPGVTAVVPKECQGGNCASVMLIRKGSYNSFWLCYVMNTRVVRFQVEVVQYGAAQEQFNISHAVNFWVPVPPHSEQEAIKHFLDAACLQLDTLTAEAQKAITLLQERRSALISAAVTGQIDVRGIQHQEAA